MLKTTIISYREQTKTIKECKCGPNWNCAKTNYLSIQHISYFLRGVQKKQDEVHNAVILKVRGEKYFLKLFRLEFKSAYRLPHSKILLFWLLLKNAHPSLKWILYGDETISCLIFNCLPDFLVLYLLILAFSIQTNVFFSTFHITFGPKAFLN